MQPNTTETLTPLLCLLRANGGWLTRADLARFGYDERDVRYIRQTSKGAIIFGQQGYKATECATLAEIDACAATLKSQADVMYAEAGELWAYKNRRIREQEQNGQQELAL